EPVHVLPPSDEVVHLLELDPASEEPELTLELSPALLDRRRPDLRRDQRAFADAVEGPGQHGLGPSVHRRGIDEPHSRLERRLHHGPSPDLAPRREVEHGPGPEPDHGDIEAGRPERPNLHHGSSRSSRRNRSSSRTSSSPSGKEAISSSEAASSRRRT